MKHIILITSILCISAQADSISLFDGKQLEGWEGDKKYWSVQDGTITGMSTAETPCKKTTYLTYTKTEFANFELTLSFRFLTDSGNSGIQYRSQWDNKKNFTIKGYQADMETGPKYSGILYDQGDRGIVAKRGQQVKISEKGKKTISPKAIQDADKVSASIQKGKWSTYRVVADGNTLTHQINGFTTVEVEDNDKARREAKGLLALQLHSGPAMTVQYKDIEILELPDTKKAVSINISQPKSTPEWIWGGKANGKQTLTFSKEFDLKKTPKQCALIVNCDDSAVISVNGKELDSTNHWKVSTIIDVAKHVKVGKNTISIKASNSDGAAGLLVQLSDILVSDASWTCKSEDKKAVTTTSLGKHGSKPWGKVLKNTPTLMSSASITPPYGHGSLPWLIYMLHVFFVF